MLLRCIGNLTFNMAKIYSSKQLAATKMSPKKETVRMILNYSKALTMVKAGRMTFECIAN